MAVAFPLRGVGSLERNDESRFYDLSEVLLAFR